ncbi:radical SAM protein with 4Fe4S-binding SPASM domain [Hydrogenispora ethanolica]|jgi:radical SAM protein with 4Fe4S-binding SPASM domain|uniref:Radical SAM protein with 4Fe4S-binding SPASM domain n=1 Tax=Hydrogenispora ethanolica TaxID=1082276 RepID=A0A4V2QF81_HYDET|nr:radical SAM protein [Hydrogenispora ethanolica]TCL70907.1 radical SAM protein with 4Fe4S-binding SPASM domain [Hydrogenispora ethanolica]
MLISWNVTRECNLFCRHCYRESGPGRRHPQELTTAEGLKLLDQIKSAGFKLVIFSGGEPLLREDLLELTAYASQIGLRPVLGTNGMLLEADLARQLRESGVSGVAVSLDSDSPEYHDRFRNCPGAWDGAVRGIHNAVGAGLRVQVNMTLTEANLDRFAATVDRVSGWGVRALHPFFLVPTGRGRDLADETLQRERYFEMIRTVLAKQHEAAIELKPTCAPQFLPMAKEMGLPMRFSRGCLAGTAYCCILPNGDVHICPYLPVKVGNVREENFDIIWRESAVFAQLRDFQAYEGRCGRCPEIASCGGCRARAYYYHDRNYLAEEPWCYRGAV